MTKYLVLISILTFSTQAISQSDTPNAVVSVIVDGANLNHVREVVTEARSLSRKVPIRNLLLIQKIPDVKTMSNGKNETNPLEQQKLQAAMQEMQAGMQEVRVLNLEQSEGKTDLSLLDKLRITNSPTWVVRHNGRNYIYEGYPSIDRYFTSNGTFKEGE